MEPHKLIDKLNSATVKKKNVICNDENVFYFYFGDSYMSCSIHTIDQSETCSEISDIRGIFCTIE